MHVVNNELVVAFDVDDTLVMWGDKHNKPHKSRVKVKNPYSNSVHYLKPHKKHIELLKTYKGRGYTIIVWSAGGYLWAKEVIEALKLNDYVDIVTTKMLKYVDDLQAEDVLGTRVYLEDK